MAVGQRVTAFHPKERHLFSGTVLTPDGDHYRVQFDRPKLGVQHVKDWLLLPLLDGSRGIDFTSPHGQLGQPLGQQNLHGAHDGAAPAPAPAPAPAAPPGRQSWEADAKGAERGAERSGAPLAAAPVGAVSSAPDAPGSSQPLAAAPLVGASESTAPAAGPVGGIASVVRSDLKELQLLAYAMRLLERKRLLLDELKAVTHQGEKELIRVAHQIERAVAEGRAVLIVSEDDIAPERSIAEGRRVPIRVEVTAAQQRLLGQVPSPMTLPAVGALLTQLRAQHGALGLAAVRCVPVVHCADAWGVVLSSHDGWTLVYSGDTRPCEALVAAGQVPLIVGPSPSPSMQVLSTAPSLPTPHRYRRSAPHPVPACKCSARRPPSPLPTGRDDPHPRGHLR
jgi:hypothetical protein